MLRTDYIQRHNEIVRCLNLILINKFGFSIFNCILSKHLCFHYIFKMLYICTYIHRDSLWMGKLQIQTDTQCFIKFTNIRSCAVFDRMMKYSWKNSKFVPPNFSSIYTNVLLLKIQWINYTKNIFMFV